MWWMFAQTEPSKTTFHKDTGRSEDIMVKKIVRIELNDNATIVVIVISVCAVIVLLAAMKGC